MAVSLDDVGNAEAVLLRLIRERKTIGDAAAALEVYREVLSETPHAQLILQEMKEQIEQLQLDMAEEVERRQDMIDETQRQVAAVRDAGMAVVQCEIDEMRKTADYLKVEVQLLQNSKADMIRQQQIESDQYNRDIGEVKQQLVVLRQEYDTIKEAFRKSAVLMAV